MSFCTTRRLFLGALGLAAWPAQATPRPPAMLARDAPVGMDPAGWLVSEKFDGVRALWDGQRLRFRSGLPVPAPAGFTDALPPLALDGELWLGRGRFEAISGLVRRGRPDDAAWREVRYLVFDQPRPDLAFEQRAGRLQAVVRRVAQPWLQAVEQQRIAGAEGLQRRLQAVLAAGGEGLMLHRADATWQPGRSDALLKLKPLADAEAVVIGVVPGRGRHAGRMGALRVRSEDGVEFLLGTGFSDAQRDSPPPPGSTVTYTHRGHTAAGVPRFASFLRLRDV
jgi:DNA ligase-1